MLRSVCSHRKCPSQQIILVNNLKLWLNISAPTLVLRLPSRHTCCYLRTASCAHVNADSVWRRGWSVSERRVDPLSHLSAVEIVWFCCVMSSFSFTSTFQFGICENEGWIFLPPTHFTSTLPGSGRRESDEPLFILNVTRCLDLSGRLDLIVCGGWGWGLELGGRSVWVCRFQLSLWSMWDLPDYVPAAVCSFLLSNHFLPTVCLFYQAAGLLNGIVLFGLDCTECWVNDPKL